MSLNYWGENVVLLFMFIVGLWKMLIDKRMNRTDLKDMAGISFNVLAKMGKGETVSLESLYKICKTLNCNIGDIMEFADVGADA